ncbi:CRISPR-associated endonuclease Cas3'', partial [Ruminococcus flavefaciens]|uniref:CRISPR-associated endonuclease Cas3'' n=1 Tax=Ruminococcus flavefaciens TaxID=1265 RepID=UPI00037D628E
MKYAHAIDERRQSIKDHLTGVAEKAASYSAFFLRDYAYIIGLAHDIGKYAADFQKRLEGSSVKFEHSSCGAIELGELAKDNVSKGMTYMLQYCVAGHHTGLPDGGTEADNADADNTLHAKLKRKGKYTGNADYSSYKDEIELGLPDYSELLRTILETNDQTDAIEKYAFFTRYLFSCLTDADFIDTEQFCSPEKERGLQADFSAMSDILEKKLSSFIADTPLKKARNALQEQAVKNIEGFSPVSILDMPTGSGKTLCSMKIALKKLIEGKKKRIIYVIPYTSIIEQTADIFEKMFGEYADVVQHHSNYCYDTENDSTAEKRKLSTENWDAAVIITTSVQFFQSLYHYKSSSLRKLHNIADSVILFDEVHMLPEKFLQPCLRAIGYITKYLNSECIFLSATMPDYSVMFERYIGDIPFRELIKDKSDFKAFRKCIYSYIGTTDMKSIVSKAMEYDSSLIIVNSRKTARETYKLISGKKYHLSTYMTPDDRSEKI